MTFGFFKFCSQKNIDRQFQNLIFFNCLARMSYVEFRHFLLINYLLRRHLFKISICCFVAYTLFFYNCSLNLQNNYKIFDNWVVKATSFFYKSNVVQVCPHFLTFFNVVDSARYSYLFESK